MVPWPDGQGNFHPSRLSFRACSGVPSMFYSLRDVSTPSTAPLQFAWRARRRATLVLSSSGLTELLLVVVRLQPSGFILVFSGA
jgi:hypothetical protein